MKKSKTKKSMNNQEQETLLDQLGTEGAKPEILNDFRRPNVQFIRRAIQFNPSAKQLVEIFEKFRDILKIKGLESASIRTGNGFLINTAYFDIKSFNRDNIIEIIDFDPVRNNMMVIGNEPPSSNAALHWFIYRGLPWINGVININNPELMTRFKNGNLLFMDQSKDFLDTNLALMILKNAKNAETQLIEGQGILVVGRTVAEAFEVFNKNLKEFSDSADEKNSKEESNEN